MATYARLKHDRKSALRGVKREQRALDSSLERLERRLEVLRSRKTIIDREAALTLVPLWNDFVEKLRIVEKVLADFISVVSI